ncbi:hypothetical protein A3Q56_06116, partial [Intoshia linei]
MKLFHKVKTNRAKSVTVISRRFSSRRNKELKENFENSSQSFNLSDSEIDGVFQNVASDRGITNDQFNTFTKNQKLQIIKMNKLGHTCKVIPIEYFIHEFRCVRNTKQKIHLLQKLNFQLTYANF